MATEPAYPNYYDSHRQLRERLLACGRRMGMKARTGSGSDGIADCPHALHCRFTIRRTCEHSRDDTFACALYRGCCFGRFRSILANRCALC